MIESIRAINSRIQEIQSGFASIGMGSPVDSNMKSFAAYMQEAENQLNKTSEISSEAMMVGVNGMPVDNTASINSGVNNINEIEDYIISNVGDINNIDSSSLANTTTTPVHSRGINTYKSMAENFPTKYDDIIEEAAARYDVSKDLIKAVIKTESNYNADAISRRGAIGLMQLMPSTADSMGVAVDSLTDARTNIFAGTKYLSEMLSRYDGQTDLALSAYNAGPGAVRDRVPNIAETQSYVTKILGYIE